MTQSAPGVGEPRWPLFGPSLWGPAVLLLVACLAILYYGHRVATGLDDATVATARAGGSATAQEIAGFIDREHERLRAFAEEKAAQIRHIADAPDDWTAIEALRSSVRRLFRGAYAFTVTGPDGNPVFEDFDGLVGPVCLAAMHDYLHAIRQGDLPDALPPIHPVPGAYHFDLISPWQTEDGRSGLFFVSMSPARVAGILEAAEKASGTRILLVNSDRPTLIEVTAAGARDRLGEAIHVDTAALPPQHFAIDLPGTHWRLLVIPDVESLSEEVRRVYLGAAGLVLALLLISGVLLRQIRRAEQRNSGLFMRSLQSSLGRQRAILQSMVDGMVTIDAGGTILNVNNAVTRLFGYETGELIGANVSVLMPEPDRSAHDGYLRHYLDTGESKILGNGREVTARRKDGSLFPVLLTLGESIEGEQRIFVGILHDMTAYNAAQRKIVAQSVAIEHSRHELQEISQMASQNLQLPLQRIAQLGERLGFDSPQALSGAEFAELRDLGSTARGMSETAKGLADCAGGEEQPCHQAVELDEVLNGARNDLGVRIAEAGATVTIDAVGRVIGDPRQLRQVFSNLLDNALKFREPSRPPQVRVSVESCDAEPGEAHGTLVVRIADNGIGIPDDQLQAVFEAFRRLHPRTAYPGAGLGLAICRRILDGMGAQISAESRLGEGSTFVVRLPRAERMPLRPLD